VRNTRVNYAAVAGAAGAAAAAAADCLTVHGFNAVAVAVAVAAATAAAAVALGAVRTVAAAATACVGAQGRCTLEISRSPCLFPHIGGTITQRHLKGASARPLVP